MLNPSAASVGALLVQFRRGKHCPCGSSRHEDCAVIQQVCGVRLARGCHAPGERKSSCGWIVDFCGGEGGVSDVSSRNQHGSVSEQCGGLEGAWGSHAALCRCEG